MKNTTLIMRRLYFLSIGLFFTLSVNAQCEFENSSFENFTTGQHGDTIPDQYISLSDVLDVFDHNIHLSTDAYTGTRAVCLSPSQVNTQTDLIQNLTCSKIPTIVSGYYQLKGDIQAQDTVIISVGYGKHINLLSDTALATVNKTIIITEKTNGYLKFTLNFSETTPNEAQSIYFAAAIKRTTASQVELLLDNIQLETKNSDIEYSDLTQVKLSSTIVQNQFEVFNLPEGSTVKIMSVVGKKVLEKKNCSSSEVINLAEDLTSGKYLVKINDGNDFIIKDIIKE